MATAAQKLSSPSPGVQASLGAGCRNSNTTTTTVVATMAVPEDPSLTPSQRRKRPLSIIKESDTDSSEASSDAHVGGREGKQNNKNNSGSGGSDSGVGSGSSSSARASANFRPGHSSSTTTTTTTTATTTCATSGKSVSTTRTVVHNTSVRSSANVRRLTDKFERSGTSSPSRGTSRVTNNKHYNASTVSSSNKTCGNSNNAPSSPRSALLKPPTPKSGPTLIMKTSRPPLPSSSSSSASNSTTTTTATTAKTSPRSLATTISTTTRTSSPSQNNSNKTSARTGRGTTPPSSDSKNKSYGGRGTAVTKPSAGKSTASKSSGASVTSSESVRKHSQATPHKGEQQRASRSPRTEGRSEASRLPLQNGGVDHELQQEKGMLLPENSKPLVATAEVGGDEEEENVEGKVTETIYIEDISSASHQISLSIEVTSVPHGDDCDDVTPASRDDSEDAKSKAGEDGDEVTPALFDDDPLARIREAAECLKLTPSSPSSTPTSPSSMFGQRARRGGHQTSPPLAVLAPCPEDRVASSSGGSGGGDVVPHITITHSDGLTGIYRPPPPKLGPTLPPMSSSSNSPSSPNSSPSFFHPSVADKLNQMAGSTYHGSSCNNNTTANGNDPMSSFSTGTNSISEDLSSSVSNNNNNNNSSNGSSSSSSSKSALLYNITNLNYQNSNNSDRRNHKLPPWTSLHKTQRTPYTPSLSQSSSTILPYYKLLNNAFLSRRLSSGGSSIYEEQEEEEEEENAQEEDGDAIGEKKSASDTKERETFSSTFSSTSSSSHQLLSERGSSVSSAGSATSSNADPTSPLLSQTFSASDLNRLKETADKLRLATRRDSTMAWRQKYMVGAGSPGGAGGCAPGGMLRVAMIATGGANGGAAGLGGKFGDDGKLTQDRKQRIDAALDWLREELQEMRTQDQSLARQLLTIRHDIHQLKLQRCTEEHQDLIDDFRNELEELQEFSDVLDLPQPVYGGDNPLRHVGITRLNLSARRFSAC